MADLLGIDRRENRENPNYLLLKTGVIPNRIVYADRYAKVTGSYRKPDGTPSSMYNYSKWQYFLDAPFWISAKCCDYMKKRPAHTFAKQTGRKPITAQMASESRLRLTKWLQHGCNGFDMKSPISNPMSFWTEQDVLHYIKENNLPTCSVYGDLIEIPETEIKVKDKDSLELFGTYDSYLKFTGCQRTGCMFCGYGCHLEKPEDARFLKMKETHPKQYDYIMRPKEQGGLNYKEVIDWINEHGNFHILY